MKLDKDIQKIFNMIKKKYGNSSDIVTRIIEKKSYKIGYIFLESVSSDDKISDFLNKAIINFKNKNILHSTYNLLKNNLFNSNIKTLYDYENLFYLLSSGYTIIVFEGENKALAVETKSTLDRGVVESTSEPIIRGPKDSFTENHSKNIGLIRKRVKDYNLWFNDTIIGRKTKTKVTVAYIKDIANIKHVNKIIEKLNKIDIDGIIDSGYIRELIEENKRSLFPKVISTERPDLTCTALLNGKIVILVENTPFVLILPATLTSFIHSQQDYYEKPFNASFSRMLRVICFFLALLTPAIYISLMTYNHEIIPDQLIISLAAQRDGVPFPTAVEVLLFVITFEMLREADIHAPSFSGSAMNVVGALILGDAAVAAGIVSPIVIIVVATTSISELVFFDVDFIDALREWRLLFIIAATFLGIVGVVTTFIMFIAKLTSVECLGVNYLEPFSPLRKDSLGDSFIRLYRKKLNRPSYLTNNTKRIGDL